MVTSDHGENLGDHGRMDHQFGVEEGRIEQVLADDGLVAEGVVALDVDSPSQPLLGRDGAYELAPIS